MPGSPESQPIPDRSLHDRLVDVVVKDKPGGGVFSDAAVHTLAKLGSELVTALRFRNPKDPQDKAIATGLGIAEILEHLGQTPLLHHIGQLVQKEEINKE
jgi:hypothetical protein